MPAPPWSIVTGLDRVLERWLADESLARCLVADRLLPAEPPGHAALPSTLDARLLSALHSQGIDALYRHQIEAVQAACDKRHVVIATPTASGKSLCFHLPVLDAIARDPSATALFLYPTKALSRDQEQSLQQFVKAAGLDVGATVYDGDTPGDARRAARQRAQLVLTNPDMLHAGILPQHARWARTMQNLRYVIVDELHTYRGIFGSHVAQVLERLKRVARFHGAAPTFIAATATIGNPVEHAARLLGVAGSALVLIDQSTAPRGARRVLVYNPPVVNAELGIRASCLESAVRLAADLVAARVRTIVFGQSRNSVEIMLKYLRDRFAGEPALHDGIVAYRGGYLPDQRRRVERGLRTGEILCVVATSALELGIDIGDLDAVVCAGYSGSLAETWQRFGRAGRRASSSLAVLVTSSAPLDQYLAASPAMLLDGDIERARVDRQNTEVLVQHLKCAAFELPFRRDEAFRPLDEDDTEAALGFLQSHGVVHAARERYHWTADAFPANHVSLRRVGWDNFVIIEEPSMLTLAELDWHSAPSMLHEQAIYQHDGCQYQVERLDYDNHKAFVRRVEPDYFTTALKRINVRVLAVEAERTLPPTASLQSVALPGGPETAEPRSPLPPGVRALPLVGWGQVCITEKIVGYKKVKFHTHENAGYGDVRLPDIDMHTSSFWLTVPADAAAAVGRARAVEGLAGLLHALKTTSALALMCDMRDIGRAIGDGEQQQAHEQFSATGYLYDSVAGGVGIAERIHERATELVSRSAAMIASCRCSHGCPACVGATALGTQLAAGTVTGQAAILRKRAALALLAVLGIQHAPPRSAQRTAGMS